MRSTTESSVPVPAPVQRPRALRRVAIAASGVLASALPVVFTTTISGMLLTGAESGVGTAGVVLGADLPWTPVALAAGALLLIASRIRR